MDRFSWFCLGRSAEAYQHLVPADVVSKKTTYNCSSVLNDEAPDKKCVLISKTTVPQRFCQKATEIMENSTFLVLVGALWVLRWGCIASRENDRSTQNYKLKLAFLKKNVQRAKIWGPNLGDLRRPRSKLGGKILTNSKFDVNYVLPSNMT